VVLAKNKFDPRVLSLFKSDSDVASYIVGLQDAKLDTTNVIPTERPKYVYEHLSQWAKKTQASVISRLDVLGVTYKSYWIANMIVVNSNVSIALEMAQRSEVVRVEPNKQFRVQLEVPESEDDGSRNVSAGAPAAIEWNIQWVKADQVWADYDGLGHTIANADTGVAWRHPALIQRYRGNQGGAVNHNYNWWDAIHGGGNNRCGLDSPEPCDDNGHGTHTTGTAVGYDPNGDQNIGVAPGATWIACRNMNAGFGTPQTYSECLQFFVAPTDLNGGNPNPDLAPHSVGNSYGCPPNEGCDAESLHEAVANVVRAGIFMSVSAGNSGPSCASVNDPPAIYGESFSVGALAARSRTIASYSSRGPVTIDGSGRRKPNIACPGSSVRSAYPPTGYATLSGTSMASPAVTGAIPLVWQAKPNLLRQVSQTERLLENTAIPVATRSCSSPSDPDVPNNVYGYGDMDILAAVNE